MGAIRKAVTGELALPSTAVDGAAYDMGVTMNLDAPHLCPVPRRRFARRRWGGALVLVSLVLGALAVLAPSVNPLGIWTCASVVVVLALGRIVVGRHGFGRVVADLGTNEDALVHLRAGRYAEAARLWADLAANAPHAPALHALYVFNLAMTWLHLGRLEDAEVLTRRALDTGWFTTSGLAHAAPSVHLGLALILALRGELTAAQQVRDALHLEYPHDAKALLVDAVLAARDGEALIISDEELRRAEASLMPTQVRALRLIAAFTQTKDQGIAYREAVLPSDMIGLRTGELDFLTAEWPELRRYMQAHDLLGTS